MSRMSRAVLKEEGTSLVQHFWDKGELEREVGSDSRYYHLYGRRSTTTNMSALRQVCSRSSRVAREGQIWYRHQRNKRANDSSGDGASPHTIHSQPPSKRALTPRRLQMEEKGKYKSDCLFRRLTFEDVQYTYA